MAQIKVMLSAAFKEAYLQLVPQFERATGHNVETHWVATAHVMARLKEPEAARALVAHFKAPAALPVIRKTGMEPAA